MKLKGVFWKPGINECGITKLPVPFGGLFKPACELHDAMYDLGGTEDDRYKADKKFLSRMVELSRRNRHITWAFTYFWIVRACGWMFFNYRDEQKVNNA